MGPYEVTAIAGAGGMGKVYRALDTRLGRTVAIKILPEELCHNVERRRRFEQEARAISKLDHPHICTLYDIGQQDGTDYLVMEFLEGETLLARLRQGPLPLNEALKTAIELASALDRAHRSGIVHRDLKPGNVMLTKAGTKLMDFGMAKQVNAASSASNGATATTLGEVPGPVTTEGQVAGTLQYMSPEQIQGKDVDARCDIFAFGCVLYEMLAGKPTFQGASNLAVASSIMEDEPEPLSTVKSIPPALQRVIWRCLAKSPEDRYQSARDLFLDLQWIADGGPAETAVPPTRTPKTWFWLGVVVVLLVFTGAMALWRVQVLENSKVSSVTRTVVSLASSGLALTGDGLAISPDGETLAFGAVAEGQRRLYLRRMDEWQARPLAGAELGSNPFFSPDGKWVAFVTAEHVLLKIPINGGSPEVICTGIDFSGAAWGPDGRIIFASLLTPGPGLWSVAAVGGKPQRVTKPPEPSVRYIRPVFLPNGEALLFTILWSGKASVAALLLRTGEIRTVIESGKDPRYVPPGYLTYELEGHLYAVPFDPNRLEKTGPARVVVDEMGARQYFSSYDTSWNGTLVYLSASAPLAKLAWKDRYGATLPLRFRQRRYSFPALSPDGRTFAVSVDEGAGRNVWIGSIEGEPLSRLTFSDDDTYSLFSPDGKWVLFTSGHTGHYNIFRTSIDGSGKVEQLTYDPQAQHATTFAPKGNLFLFNQLGDNGDIDIMERDDSGAVRPYLKTPFSEQEAAFSPDGRSVAYTSNESGNWQVYVQSYPRRGMKKQVSVDAGQAPAWNGDGTELFYQGPTAAMVVRMAHGAPVSTPIPVFAYPMPSTTAASWSVRPDGQRFLVVESAEPASAPTQINVVSNWLQEFKAVSSHGQR